MNTVNRLLLAGCVAAGGALTAQDTILWDFETFEQVEQWQISTMYPEGVNDHGSKDWYEYSDETGALAYTLLRPSTDPAIGGTGFRWAIQTVVTPEDPQFEALRDAVIEGKTLAYDVYRDPEEGSAEWFQTFFMIQGDPGGRQNQWNDLTTEGGGWPSEPLTLTTTIDFSGQPNQTGGTGDYMPAGAESITIAFALNGPIAAGSIIVFDNIRILGESVGGDDWLGYEIDEAGWADTAGWLGNLWVGSSPWVWSDIGWIYVAEETYTEDSGAWVYVPNFGE